MQVTVRNVSVGLRRAIVRLLQPVFGKTDTVAPERVVRSIPERWFDPCVQKHVVSVEVMRSAGAETYAFSDALPPAFRTEMHFARRHVYHLRDVSVSTRTGSCIADSLYFQESYGSLRRCLLEKPFPLSKGRGIKTGQPVTCVRSAPYYHFLLEEVPRLLWALHYHNDLTVMVHQSAPSYVAQVLRMLCRTSELPFKIVATADDAVYLPSYVFTQAEAYSGFVHSTDIGIVRKHLRNSPTTQSPKKLYITREKASRCFDNEGDIISFMRERGFQTCTLEEMDFEAQINLFQNAKVVVAAHGAGLSNILWCNAGTRVIEIFSPRYFNDCYARICSELQLSYKPIFAQETQGWGYVSPEELSLALTDAATELSCTWPGKPCP